MKRTLDKDEDEMRKVWSMMRKAGMLCAINVCVFSP